MKRAGGPVPSSSSWDSIAAALLALNVAGYPLISALPSVLNVESRLITVPFRGIVLVLALFLIVVAAATGRRIGGSVPLLLLALFWAAYTFRLSLDTWLAPVALRIPPGEYWQYFVGTTVLPTLPFFFVPRRVMLRQSERALTLLSAIALVSALVVAVRSTEALSGVLINSGRLGYETLNPISLGHLGATVVIVSIARLLDNRPTTLLSWLVLLSAVGLGLVGVVASASRGPLLAVVLVLGLLFVTRLRRGRRLKTLVFAGIVLAASPFALHYAERQLGAGTTNRVLSLLQFRQEASTNYRIEIMSAAWVQFQEHPLLGSGIEEKTSGYYPHNVVLESLMATGIVGGACYVSFLVMEVFRALRLLRARPEHSWLAAVAVQYVIADVVSGSLWAEGTMLSLLALCVVSSARPGHSPLVPSTPVRSHAASSVRADAPHAARGL